MKKLVIVAAAMAAGFAFGAGSACGPTDVVPEKTGTVCGPTGEIGFATEDECLVWDFSITVKTLAPKKIVCKGDCTTCGEKTDAFYLDNGTRKIQGFAWLCGSFCETIEDGMNIVLWEKSTKSAVVPVLYSKETDGYWPVPNVFTTWAMYRYGKKANNVAAYWNLECGEMDWGSAEQGICVASLTGAGVKGKTMKHPWLDVEGDYCPGFRAVPKSISGSVVGYWPVMMEKKYGCDGWSYVNVLKAEMCDCWISWCDVLTEEGFYDEEDVIPAEGKWSMKYNKKLSKKGASILNLVPSYAMFAE